MFTGKSRCFRTRKPCRTGAKRNEKAPDPGVERFAGNGPFRL